MWLLKWREKLTVTVWNNKDFINKNEEIVTIAGMKRNIWSLVFVFELHNKHTGYKELRQSQ